METLPNPATAAPAIAAATAAPASKARARSSFAAAPGSAAVCGPSPVVLHLRAHSGTAGHYFAHGDLHRDASRRWGRHACSVGSRELLAQVHRDCRGDA